MTGRPQRVIRLLGPYLLCAILAVAVRLPAPPQPDAGAPWFRGAVALQGLRQGGDATEPRRNLAVALPLCAGQNIGYLAAKVAGASETMSRVAWIRGHEGYARLLLRFFWIAAAVAGSLLAVRILPGMWGVVAGLAVAVVPIGIAGTERLEGWALAAPFILAGITMRRTGYAALSWGIALSLTPLGFLPAAVTAAIGQRSQRLAVLLAVPLWFALDPVRLAAPGEVVSGLGGSFRMAGWPGIADGPSLRLLSASWTPGPVAALLGLVGAVAALRDRSIRLISLSVLLLWWLPAILGARRPDGVGLAAPLAIILAARGSEALVSRSTRGRSILAAVLVLLLLAPILGGSRDLIGGEARRRARASEMAEIVAVEVGPNGLLARDPTTPAIPESIGSFLFPTHVERPEVWDFAYWPGWYGKFTHMLFRARTLEMLEAASDDRPGARGLVFALAGHAEPVAVLGNPETDGQALLLFRLQPGPPWEPADRLELWEALEGSATEAPFLGDLAAFLAEHEESERAIELLRVALRWDRSSPRLWNNLGATLLMSGELFEAAEALTEALRIHPDAVELRHTLGVVYLEMEVPDRALKELRRVLAARPNDPRVHYDVARAAVAMKRWELAVHALEAYLATEPNPRDRDQVLATLAQARRLAGMQP